MTKAFVFFFSVVVLVGFMAFSNAPERLAYDESVYKAMVR